MSARASRTVTLPISGPLQRADLPALLERGRTLLQTADVVLLRCELSGVGAELPAIEALARLALAAHRQDCRIELCGAASELRELVSLLGLSEVLLADEAR